MAEHRVAPLALFFSLLLSWPAMATGLAARPAASPQADGVAHTLRQIPEACIRLQGMFSGRADHPYALQAVPTQERCPRRAVFAGIADAPQADEGWQLDEQIVVPSAACPALRMTLSLWRHPGQVRKAERDGQGQVRVYVEQARQAADGAEQATLPQWRASWQVQGRCR